MHWSQKIAKEIIRRSPDKEEYVCAAGISPSGSIHIGNFRDIVTSYFVCVALRGEGKKARLLFSWDEFDRLRKVPVNVQKIAPDFEKYIGILDYILILFTGSRGGMLFGIVELIICIVVMFILDKRHRPAIAAIVGVSLVVTCLTYRTWFDTLSYTLLRLIDPDENSIRIQLIGRGIEDFKANPLFGRGIGGYSRLCESGKQYLTLHPLDPKLALL